MFENFSTIAIEPIEPTDSDLISERHECMMDPSGLTSLWCILPKGVRFGVRERPLSWYTPPTGSGFAGSCCSSCSE
eukprot:2795219-Rhodomonas_salina.1